MLDEKHHTAAEGPEGTGGATETAMPMVAADTGRHISVSTGDENVAKIQLAARWAEEFPASGGDSLEERLRRFRRAYAFIDSVTKSVDPDEGS